MKEITYERGKCLFCYTILAFLTTTPSVVVIFDIGHSEEARHRIKTCYKCGVNFHYSHYTKHKTEFSSKSLAKFFYSESLEKEYFLSTSSTGFTTRFLRSFMSEIYVVPEMSFFAKAKSFNMSVNSGRN